MMMFQRLMDAEELSVCSPVTLVFLLSLLYNRLQYVFFWRFLMNKHLFFSILVMMMVLCLGAACFAETSVADNALPVFIWERNGTEHWKELPSGSKSDVGPHVFDNVNCIICGSEVWMFDDGSADVSDYNQYGELTRYTSFDPRGQVTIEICYAYDYDTDGCLLTSREFIEDVLTGEVTYAQTEDGKTIPVSQVTYYDDDTWAVNEYDEYGNLVYAVTFDTDGTPAFESFSTYLMSAEGYYYEASKSSLFADGATFYYEYDEYGNPTRTVNVEADGTVWEDSTCQYQYENGTLRWKKQYFGEVLTLEVHYNEDGFAAMETEFFDDGSRIITEYNSYTDPVIITFYAADGTVETVQTYEYEYDDNLNWIIVRAYTDGTLVIQTEYATDDNWHYACRETLYEEDGSYIVYEFNIYEELISATSYNAAGQIIP